MASGGRSQRETPEQARLRQEEERRLAVADTRAQQQEIGALKRDADKRSRRVFRAFGARNSMAAFGGLGGLAGLASGGGGGSSLFGGGVPSGPAGLSGGGGGGSVYGEVGSGRNPLYDMSFV